MRRVAVALVVGGTLAVTSRAGASPTARLVYVRGEGAETCPDEEALKQAVAARLGYDPFRPFAQPTLFAEVHREKGRFAGSLKMVDAAGLEQGARKLDEAGDDCAEITGAMALSMSIAIDPRSALEARPAPAATSTPPPAAPGPSPDDAPPAPAAPPETPRISPTPLPVAAAPARFGVGLGLHGTLGVSPVATVGARITGEIAWSSLSAGLELRADLPATANIAGGGGGGVRTWLVAAALVPCWRVAWASMCAVGLLGRLQAETVDVASPTRETFAFAAAGLRFAADFPLAEGLAVRFGGDLLGTITPFVLDVDGQRVYDSPVVSGLVGATLVKFF